MRFTTVLKMAAPYIAVTVFWTGLENAWLAVLAYHAQMLAWSWRRLPRLVRGWNARWFATTVAPCLAVGPLLYALLPTIESVPIGTALARYGLEGAALYAMIPYFGLVHPALEQAHWSGLRERTGIAHAAFAGYHAAVLSALLTLPWGLFSVFVLLGASVVWGRMQRDSNGLRVHYAGHAVADLGIVIAAVLRATA